MYLKELEITGFKSFADKTKLEFNQGITAIVGPNGSGKSNITEALRWVLGEQSAKSLRGGKMPDIIFAGTEKRKALNYAEVEAKFDNSDHYLEGDYGKEIRVSRRLYRNGDSDFLINGKKKRLKDIHNLFLDVGMGRDSLSIISQGRIEAVFNAKAEDRRSIIEEAAGVAKYKSQKRETELKLKNVQDNLDRLEDIIFELSGQLTPLRAQREAALKFQELDAVRSKLALSVLIAQIRREKASLDEASAKLQEVNQQIETSTSAKSKYEADLADLKAQLEESEKNQEAMQAQIVQLTELKGQLEKKVELFDLNQSNQEKAEQARAERQEQLTSQKNALEIELSENAVKRSELQEQADHQADKIEDLTEQLALFKESPEVQMDRLREKYLELVNQEAQLSNQLTKNQSDAENIKRQQIQDSESNQEAANKLTASSEELAKEEQKLEEVKAETAEILADFRKSEEAAKTLRHDLESAQSAQFKSLDQLNKLKASLSSLENIRDNHSNLFAGVRAVMRANLAGIIGVVADLITFDKQYETAMEVALGGAAQNIVTEDENAARKAIAYLRDGKHGRATFLPLTTIRERDYRDFARVSQMPGFIGLASSLVQYESRLHPAISNLLGRTVIVDTVDHASSMARALNYNTRIVSLDGTQINPGGSYAGGSRNNRNSSTFVNNEIASLQEKIAQVDLELREKEQHVQKAQSEVSTLNQKIQELRENGEAKRLLERESEMKVAQLKRTKSDLEELLSISDSDQEKVRLSELAKEDESIKGKLSEIAEEKERLNEELDHLRENSAEQDSIKAEKQAALTAEQIESSRIKSELSFAKSEEARLTASLNGIQAELSELENSSHMTLDHEQNAQFKTQLAETNEKLKDLSVKQVSLRFAREDLSAQIDDIQAQNKELIEQDQAIHDQKTRLELSIESYQRHLLTAQQTLSENYQMSYDEAVTSSEELSSDELPQYEKEVRSYERQIRALGPVNLEAIKQFEEVNERYEFLNSQKEDLLESKRLLTSTMNEMDDEVRTRFKSTFDAVRQSFKITFQQMFGGGEADLLLTSDDLLEAGIDIIAQPPGKRLGSLSLMSGGEKSLTALALLFAILRVRTMPFVILDEVEAALDEANVKRFGDYMNHFNSSNQFIVVTHRKGTMAAAKVMYGVTMGEAGVSKIVSVRFDDEKTA